MPVGGRDGDEIGIDVSYGVISGGMFPPKISCASGSGKAENPSGRSCGSSERPFSSRSAHPSMMLKGGTYTEGDNHQLKIAHKIHHSNQ